MKMTMLAAASAIVITVAGAATVSAQTVRAPQGSIRGVVEAGAEAFKDIPFAAPPVGPLRWRPPQPAKAWEGVRDGSAFGPACIQPPFPFGGGGPIGTEMGDEGPFTTSEDCLNLNVRRPAGTQAGARLPVMVWIYGGAFQFGRGSQRTYTGTALVKRGVILVTPNYRLGALGFLADPELSAEDPHHSSGEYGALDAVAALQWVKDNIAAFGGDPDNVTIFGESAGGAMVGMLAGSPLTKGLFQHAISESGVFFGPPDQGGPPGGGASDTLLAVAEQSGPAFLKQAGVSSIAQARALPAERILAAGAPGPGRRPIFFRPSIDGWFLPRLTHDLLKDGAYDRCPVLVGSNSDEGVLSVPNPITVAQYQAMTRQTWGSDADRILAAYPATTDAEATHAARDLQRDATFAWAAWTWGRTQKGDKVYVYNFDHRPPFPDTAEFRNMGAPHAAELPYVFGAFNSPKMAWGPDDQVISDQMIGYWTNFARTGDPNGAGLPPWEGYTPGGEQAIHFDKATAVPGQVQHLPQLKVINDIFMARFAEAATASPGAVAP